MIMIPRCAPSPRRLITASDSSARSSRETHAKEALLHSIALYESLIDSDRIERGPSSRAGDHLRRPADSRKYERAHSRGDRDARETGDAAAGGWSMTFPPTRISRSASPITRSICASRWKPPGRLEEAQRRSTTDRRERPTRLARRLERRSALQQPGLAAGEPPAVATAATQHWPLELARKAVRLAPERGDFWNTLGVAHYRAGDWKDAAAALGESMRLRDGGDANDWLFMAMVRYRLDEPERQRTGTIARSPGSRRTPAPMPQLSRFAPRQKLLLGWLPRRERATRSTIASSSR